MHNVKAWRQLFTHLGLRFSPGAEFSVDGRHYGVFTHDWRAEPPGHWLDMMAQRELASDSAPVAPEPTLPAPLIVLSQPAFADAVRDALRHFTRPESLGSNPLLRSRLVAEFSDGSATVDALQQVVLAAAETLRVRPRDERLFRAVHHTYFQPAQTQEQVAELLDLPFSTYRYQLNVGVGRITDWLWQREVNGMDE